MLPRELNSGFIMAGNPPYKRPKLPIDANGPIPKYEDQSKVDFDPLLFFRELYPTSTGSPGMVLCAWHRGDLMMILDPRVILTNLLIRPALGSVTETPLKISCNVVHMSLKSLQRLECGFVIKNGAAVIDARGKPDWQVLAAAVVADSTVIFLSEERETSRALQPYFKLESNLVTFWVARLEMYHQSLKPIWRARKYHVSSIRSWEDGWTIKAIRAHRMLDDMNQRFTEIAGGVYTYQANELGKWSIATIEPENVKTILATSFKDYQLTPLRKALFSRYFGIGIFNSDGEEWEHSRALLRPNFARKLTGDLLIHETHFANFIARLPMDGQPVDLSDLFPLLSMDISSEIFLGESTNSLAIGGTAASRKFADAFDYARTKMSLQLRLGAWAGLIPDARMDEAVKTIKSVLDGYVSHALAHREAHPNGEKGPAEGEKYVFLYELAKTQHDEKRIATELLSIFVAGRDTTANFMTLMWYHLARRPDIIEKLRNEIADLGKKPPTIDQLKSLRYLRYTINETARLYPVAPAVSRVASIDTVLPRGGGPDGQSPVFVKAGTVVRYFIAGMQARKDLYGEDALEFKPERWASIKPTWEYIPFSGGPRICIGQQFATTIIGYNAVRLLQTFKDIVPGDDTTWQEKFSSTLISMHGCKLRLTPE
ncbi:hypothetical protein B7463_g6054, partial [Scytalidium lignicola]